MMQQRARVQEGAVDLPPRLGDWEAEGLVKTARQVAEQLASGLDTQLRRIFDTIRKLEIELERCQREERERVLRDRVAMLKPRLAYAVARQEKLQPAFRWLDGALERVHDPRDFERLVRFAEAILAYYKFKEKVRS